MLPLVFPGRVLDLTGEAACDYATRIADARRCGLSGGFVGGAIAIAAAAGHIVASRNFPRSRPWAST